MLWTVQASKQQWDNAIWTPVHPQFSVCWDTGQAGYHNLQSTIPSLSPPPSPRGPVVPGAGGRQPGPIIVGTKKLSLVPRVRVNIFGAPQSTTGCQPAVWSPLLWPVLQTQPDPSFFMSHFLWAGTSKTLPRCSGKLTSREWYWQISYLLGFLIYNLFQKPASYFIFVVRGEVQSSTVTDWEMTGR